MHNLLRGKAKERLPVFGCPKAIAWGVLAAQ